jgi:hypothetical protein
MIGLLCFVLAVLASPFKSRLRLEAENAALRHQLMVLRRQLQGRVRLTNHDRWRGGKVGRKRIGGRRHDDGSTYSLAKIALDFRCQSKSHSLNEKLLSTRSLWTPTCLWQALAVMPNDFDEITAAAPESICASLRATAWLWVKPAID